MHVKDVSCISVCDNGKGHRKHSASEVTTRLTSCNCTSSACHPRQPPTWTRDEDSGAFLATLGSTWGRPKVKTVRPARASARALLCLGLQNSCQRIRSSLALTLTIDTLNTAQCTTLACSFTPTWSAPRSCCPRSSLICDTTSTTASPTFSCSKAIAIPTSHVVLCTGKSHAHVVAMACHGNRRRKGSPTCRCHRKSLTPLLLLERRRPAVCLPLSRFFVDGRHQSASILLLLEEKGQLDVLIVAPGLSFHSAAGRQGRKRFATTGVIRDASRLTE